MNYKKYRSIQDLYVKEKKTAVDKAYLSCENKFK